MNIKKKNDPSQKIIVGPSESMSKSKKNVIDPENIIKNYGADAVRLFILSDSPPEKDVQWSEQGMIASYRFLQKLWALHQKIKKKISMNIIINNKDTNLEKFINQIINKITNNLEGFNYNVIIANIYEIYNFINKEIEKDIDSKDLKRNYIKILIAISPTIPHFAAECLEDLDVLDEINWPEIDKNLLAEDKVDYVIQINGKKRAILNENRGIDQESLMVKIKSDKLSEKYLKDKSINKIIFVKDKLINILIND